MPPKEYNPRVNNYRPESSLRATVISNQISRYDEKRADWVWQNREAGDDWRQLARTLSGFQPTLAQYAEDKQRERNEQDQAKWADEMTRLEKEAAEKDRLLVEYVRNDPSYLGGSPRFQRYANQQMARILSSQASSHMSSVYQSASFMNAATAEELEALTQQELDRWEDEHFGALRQSEDGLTALAQQYHPQRERILAQIRETWAQDRREATVAQGLEAHQKNRSAEIHGFLAAHDLDSPEERLRFSTLLSAGGDELARSGVAYHKAYDATLESVFQAIPNIQDEATVLQLLDSADFIKVGEFGGPSDALNNRKRAVLDNWIEQKYRREELEERHKERQERAELKALVSKGSEYFYQNPDSDLADFAAALGRSPGDYQTQQAFFSVQNTFNNTESSKESDILVAECAEAIRQGRLTLADITGKYRNGELTRAGYQQLSKLEGIAKDAAEASEKAARKYINPDNDIRPYYELHANNLLLKDEASTKRVLDQMREASTLYAHEFRTWYEEIIQDGQAPSDKECIEKARSLALKYTETSNPVVYTRSTRNRANKGSGYSLQTVQSEEAAVAARPEYVHELTQKYTDLDTALEDFQALLLAPYRRERGVEHLQPLLSKYGLELKDVEPLLQEVINNFSQQVTPAQHRAAQKFIMEVYNQVDLEEGKKKARGEEYDRMPWMHSYRLGQK